MYLHTYVHHGITHNSRDVEKPKCPAMDEWIYKMWSINKMKYYTSFKKEESLDGCTRMWCGSDGLGL